MIHKVCSVLESLEQEYRRDEDWCGGRDKLGPATEIDHVIPLISKHLEQKEAFLKVRTHCHPSSGTLALFFIYCLPFSLSPPPSLPPPLFLLSAPVSLCLLLLLPLLLCLCLFLSLSLSLLCVGFPHPCIF